MYIYNIILRNINTAVTVYMNIIATTKIAVQWKKNLLPVGETTLVENLCRILYNIIVFAKKKLTLRRYKYILLCGASYLFIYTYMCVCVYVAASKTE